MKVRCNWCMAVFEEEEIIIKDEIEYCLKCDQSGYLMDLEEK